MERRSVRSWQCRLGRLGRQRSVLESQVILSGLSVRTPPPGRQLSGGKLQDSIEGAVRSGERVAQEIAQQT